MAKRAQWVHILLAKHRTNAGEEALEGPGKDVALYLTLEDRFPVGRDEFEPKCSVWNHMRKQLRWLKTAAPPSQGSDEDHLPGSLLSPSLGKQLDSSYFPGSGWS